MKNSKKEFSLRNLYRRYEEHILYMVFGIFTTLISISVYGLLTEFLKVNFLAANIAAWIAAVLFAFFTNRSLVFKTDKNSPNEIIAQMLYFISGRFLTLLTEEAILWTFITLLSFPNMPVKILSQIIIIVLNYLISRFIIFKK